MKYKKRYPKSHTNLVLSMRVMLIKICFLLIFPFHCAVKQVFLNEDGGDCLKKKVLEYTKKHVGFVSLFLMASTFLS